MSRRILILEDEKDIRDLLALYLKREGYRVDGEADGQESLRRLSRDHYDLLILDLMLPGMDGLEVCRALRAQPQTASLPIIMLTAKAEESDRIVGLEIGADDYVTKPFSPREVVARAKALFRRMEKGLPVQKKYEYGEIQLDTEKHEISYRGKTAPVTVKEFKLLEYLFANTGRVLSRDVLLNEIWGYDYFGTTRTVDVHIARLRQKFPILNRYLISVKGLGYKLQEGPGRQ